MVVGFNNMIVFAKFENEKHFVIRVNEDLDEDTDIVPNRFLNNNDSGELFDIVTLKPTPTTSTTPAPTTTTQFPRFSDIVRQAQREALPGFDPDKQSLANYLEQVSFNMSKMAQKSRDD